MTQPPTSGIPSHDVATVVIEGNAEKVYGTALKAIEATPNLRITRQAPGQRVIDFSDGNRAAGLKVSQVNEKVVHLLIANAVLNPVLAWLGNRKMEFVPLLRATALSSIPR